MSPTRSPKHSTPRPVSTLASAAARDHGRAVCGPGSRSGHVVPGAECGPVQPSLSAARSQAARVPAIGCIVGTHAAELSSPALSGGRGGCPPRLPQNRT
jgi:hypothetical protein